MDRINTATKAVDLFGPGKHGFRAGNIGTGTLATKLSEAYWNVLQETIIRFIEGAGLAPDAEDYDQLTAAFNAKLAAYFAALGDIAYLDVVQVFTKAQGSAPVVLADAAPVPVDLSLSNVFTLAPTVSRTLQNPSNVVVGRPFLLIVTQPAGGGCGLAFDTNYLFSDDAAPANTITPNAVDIFIGIGLPANKVFLTLQPNAL